MQNKLKAATALMISAAGAAVTLPSISPLTTSMSSFTLGLLNHGFLAATIGGLADWFAVVALFHKPLGISWRTEILKKNRKRIMDAIVDFVGSDLLSAKNIINNLKSENIANLLISYFQQNGGRDRIKTLINDTLVEIASTADTKSISKSIDGWTTNKITIRGLKRKTKYYVRVRSMVNNTLFSNWSKAKSRKTK